jgi:hypothetical protein
MMNRTVTYAAAISFGVIGLSGLFSIPANAIDAGAAGASTANAGTANSRTPNSNVANASAADECLAAPKGASPQGSHWYYRLDKSTGRKCWYLGPQGAKLQGAKLKSAAPVARSSGPKTDDNTADNTANADQQQPLQPSVSNARAELRTTTPTPAASNPSPALPGPSLLASQVTAPSSTASIPGSAQTLASRWPDPDAFKPTSDTSPDTSPQVAQNAAPTPAEDATEPQQQAAPPPPAPASAAPAAMHSTTAQSVNPALTPARVMMAAIFIILAIAAIFARNAFRYFAGPHVKITRRRGLWDQADYGEQALPSYAEMMAPARSHRDPDKREEVDEIELLLRRAAKREAQQRYFSS